MAVEIDSKEEGMFVAKYNEVFEQIWNDESSITLDQHLLMDMKKSFMKNKYGWKSVSTWLTEDTIKPN